MSITEGTHPAETCTDTCTDVNHLDPKNPQCHVIPPIADLIKQVSREVREVKVLYDEVERKRRNYNKQNKRFHDRVNMSMKEEISGKVEMDMDKAKICTAKLELNQAIKELQEALLNLEKLETLLEDQIDALKDREKEAKSIGNDTVQDLNRMVRIKKDRDLSAFDQTARENILSEIAKLKECKATVQVIEKECGERRKELCVHLKKVKVVLKAHTKCKDLDSDIESEAEEEDCDSGCDTDDCCSDSDSDDESKMKVMKKKKPVCVDSDSDSDSDSDCDDEKREAPCKNKAMEPLKKLLEIIKEIHQNNALPIDPFKGHVQKMLCEIMEKM